MGSIDNAQSRIPYRSVNPIATQLGLNHLIVNSTYGTGTTYELTCAL